MKDIPPTEFLASITSKRVWDDLYPFAAQFAWMSEVWEACEQATWLHWIIELVCPLTKRQAVQLALAHAECIPTTKKEALSALAAVKRWLEDPTEKNRLATRREGKCPAYVLDVSYATYVAEDYSAARSAASVALTADAYGDQGRVVRSIISNPFKP